MAKVVQTNGRDPGATCSGRERAREPVRVWPTAVPGRMQRRAHFVIRPGARGGTRTLTPRRAGGFKPPTSAGYATRAGGDPTVNHGRLRPRRRDHAAADSGPTAPVSTAPVPTPATTPPTVCSSVSRTRRAASPVSPLATITPSTMSTTTSAVGRDRNRTAITGPPGSRRIERATSERRGGVRKAGTTNPAARAAAPIRRASSANRIGGVTSISRIEYVG
ncbi:MAG: hypothetical protein QOE62_3110 [Actinomycetota bacterium]|nr:hypothetical protein [Actinomycetota bacterium]